MKNSAVSLMISGSNDEDRDIKGFVTFYVFIFLTFIAIGPFIFSSDWVSSSDFHASTEISSSLIALIAAIACLIYYFSLKSKYFLIIGLGFLIAGSEDFINGIFSFRLLFESSGMDFSRFLSGTYTMSKSMLAILIIVAALLEFKTKKTENIKSEALILYVIV